ncbi:MAG: Rid family hydrolase [Rhodospirillaceae bacterium]
MTITLSTWSPVDQGTDEYFIVVRPVGKGPYGQQLTQAFEIYEQELGRLGLGLATGLTVTFFLSDSANQEEELRQHDGFIRLVEAGVAVTVIQQPPTGCKIVMLACHARRLEGSAVRAVVSVGGSKPKAMGLSVTTPAYRILYLKNLASPWAGDAAEQTEALFGVPGSGAQSNGISLDEVVRTWLYIQNVDVNYTAISVARNRVFDRYGITLHAGFPASTGIDGRTCDQTDLLTLDLLAISGLQPGQNRRMEALEHMNATVEYGVTFERGREVVFGDRRHFYVSGTASISNTGEILHPGDVTLQTARAIENITALLAASDASLSDLRYVIVYLRDSNDTVALEAVMDSGPMADIPRIVVHAPVCRPGWLIEMEGFAIDGKGDKRFAPF